MCSPLVFKFIHGAGFFDFYMIANHAFALPLFWLMCILVPFVTIAIDMCATAVSATFVLLFICCLIFKYFLIKIQREFYPTLLDACIESDRGLRGDGSRDFQLRDSIQEMLGKYTMPSIAAAGRFRLDWSSLKDLYSRMGADEKDILGIHVCV